MVTTHINQRQNLQHANMTEMMIDHCIVINHLEKNVSPSFFEFVIFPVLVTDYANRKPFM